MAAAQQEGRSGEDGKFFVSAHRTLLSDGLIVRLGLQPVCVGKQIPQTVLHPPRRPRRIFRAIARYSGRTGARLGHRANRVQLALAVPARVRPSGRSAVRWPRKRRGPARGQAGCGRKSPAPTRLGSTSVRAPWRGASPTRHQDRVSAPPAAESGPNSLFIYIKVKNTPVTEQGKWAGAKLPLYLYLTFRQPEPSPCWRICQYDWSNCPLRVERSAGLRPARESRAERQPTYGLYDRYVAGDDEALMPAQKRGLELLKPRSRPRISIPN